MTTLLQDLRYGLRLLVKSPGFTAVSVLTLALGIGATTAIFSVVNAVLLQPLPFAEADRLVALRELSREGRPMHVPEQNFLDWQAGARSYERMAFYNSFEENIAGGSEPVRTSVSQVSSEFFEVLRVRPHLGRLIGPEDQQADAVPAVVVSHDYWRRSLGGAASLEGRMVRAAGYSLPIMGVTPPGFRFPAEVDVWVPRSLSGPVNPSRSAHNWRVIARLAPGATAEQARSELSRIAQRIHGEYADVTAVDATVVPLADVLTARVRPALLMLMGAVGLLLLIACANVMNLLLARATAREREFAVRRALGATRARLVRQCLSESLLLAALAALVGVPLAGWGVDALLALGQGQIPRADGVRVDAVVLGFVLAVALLVTVLLGLVPGWRAGRLESRGSVNEAGRGSAGGAGARRVRGALAVSQVALTLMLLVGAGLLARSFGRVLSVDLGFQKESRLGLDLSLPAPRDDPQKVRVREFARALEDRLAALPGVLAVGGTSDPPMSTFDPNGRFLIEGREHSGNYWPSYRVASPGYFRTLGIPLLRGRLFDATDLPDAPQAAVISKDVADHVFPGEDPIGRRINTANMDGDEAWMTIVGVVGDVRYGGPEGSAHGAIYAHHLQRGKGAGAAAFTWVLHTAGDPAALIPAVRQAVRALDPEVAPKFITLEDSFSTVTAARRFNVTLVGAFAAVALALAALGIYGVLAYSVEQRRREIGVRMALGARTGTVTRMVVGEGLTLASVGVAVGLAGAFVLSRSLASLLFGVAPTDPATYAATVAFLVAVALAACWLPARRAARVDPMVALRCE